MGDTLKVTDVSVSYGPVEVLRKINFQISAGEFVSAIGANGAGKTSLLRALSGQATVSKGSIDWGLQKIHGRSAHHIARLGISHCPEGRKVFAPMSVKDNLLLGGYILLRRKQKNKFEEGLKQVFSLFPRLKDKEKLPAASLSGGEQQMLAVARSLMMAPQLLLLDEPTMGLAPVIIDELMAAIATLKKQNGLSVLLVEQMATRAMKITDRTLVFERGELILAGKSADLIGDPKVKKAYLGEEL